MDGGAILHSKNEQSLKTDEGAILHSKNEQSLSTDGGAILHTKNEQYNKSKTWLEVMTASPRKKPSKGKTKPMKCAEQKW